MSSWQQCQLLALIIAISFKTFTLASVRLRSFLFSESIEILKVTKSDFQRQFLMSRFTQTFLKVIFVNKFTFNPPNVETLYPNWTYCTCQSVFTNAKIPGRCNSMQTNNTFCEHDIRIWDFVFASQIVPGPTELSGIWLVPTKLQKSVSKKNPFL